MLPTRIYFAEVQTRLDDLCIVEHHQCTLWQVFRQVIEDIFAYFTFIVHQQLRVVALRYRELRNPLVRQFVIVVLNLYVFRFHHVSFDFNVQKYKELSEPPKENNFFFVFLPVGGAS